MADTSSRIALVLSGGGARGAYEAGVIHYLRTQLPPAIAHRVPFDIICGSSVGAINACFLAATSHNLEYQGRHIHKIWNELTQENIYRRDVKTLTRFLGRTLRGICSNLFFRKQSTSVGERRKSFFKGLLDTSPFPFFLKKEIPWKQISLNIQNGALKALSLTATNIHTGKTELFIDKNPLVEYTGRHQAHFVNIETRHALASAAIPILFPTVRIEKNHYCDGGLRLNTPLSPAIQLGADKILVIGLHHASERAEQKANEPFTDDDLPPSMGEVFGQVLKSVFLDRLDYDLEQLQRINKIIQWGKSAFGADFLTQINAHVGQEVEKKDIEARGLKELQVMSIFPRRDIRKIFMECVAEPAFIQKNLSAFEKMLMKILDVDLRAGHDFLSFILFVPTYLKRMLELGFEDARSHHHALIQFFEKS